MVLVRRIRRSTLARGPWRRNTLELLVSALCVGTACDRPTVPSASPPNLFPQREVASALSPSVPKAAPVDPSFVLAAAGDVNLGRDCGQRLLSDAAYDPFRGVARVWADADLRFVNLESGLSEQRGETRSPRHGLIFTGPPSGADALARGHVDVVSTANNHAWDYSRRGLLETLANLDRVGVAHTGTGRDEDEAYRPAILRVNGLTIAFFAVTQVWNLGVFSQEEARHHVAWADFSRLRESLVQARATTDFVVLSYHGGEEYQDTPVPRTRDFLAQVMGLGVDLVIGHHPHVPQGVAWFGERPAFYSLGNLVFEGLENLPWTRASFIAKLRFRRGAPVEVAVCPYVIDGFEPNALPARDEAFRRAFERHLVAISGGAGGVVLGERDALGCVRLTHP